MAGVMMTGGLCEGWIGRMSTAIDRFNKRPEIILMSRVFWRAYLDYLGSPYDGEDVAMAAFRAIEVKEDVDCPGIWIGDHPRSSLIPLKPYDPSASKTPGIEAKLTPLREVPVRFSVALRTGQDEINRQLHELAATLDERPATKAVARKLRDIMGPPR